MSGSQMSLNGQSTIEVRVPARLEFASTVRVVAASLAADAQFSVDDLDDLRLAISEVFSCVVDARRSDDETVTVLFDISGPGLDVMISATAADHAAPISLDELADSIIRAAVDEVVVTDHAVMLVKYAGATPATQDV